jgi:hypothetical protein
MTELPDNDEREDEPTQTTDKGYEIPIPSREDFFADLEKVSEPEAK